jgi:hypothetical protein
MNYEDSSETEETVLTGGKTNQSNFTSFLKINAVVIILESIII